MYTQVAESNCQMWVKLSKDDQAYPLVGKISVCVFVCCCFFHVPVSARMHDVCVRALCLHFPI